jgi:hypothetical protein
VAARIVKTVRSAGLDGEEVDKIRVA